MKMQIFVLMIGLFGSLSNFAESKEISVAVKGMVCSFCAQGIEKKFGAEDSVAKVAVNLDQHLVSLNLKEGKEIDDARIEKLLKDAGYTVDKIDRGGKAPAK